MSDATELALVFEVEIPAGWHRLPSPGAPDATAAAIEAIVGQLTEPGEIRDQLARALEAVTAVAQSPKRHGRTHWALVPDPSNGRVEALMSQGTIPGSRADLDRYRALATVNLDGPDADPANPAELVNRTVSERTLTVGDAVAIHDFVIEPVAGGVADPAVERAIVALFPARAARGIEMSIITQNLAWFEDITGYLVDITSTFRETGVKSA